MPIYAYACDACGHRQDHLQKMADAPIAVCPQCAAVSYSKQLSAPQFQLKGGGWYVTDFRDNGKKDATKTDGEGKSDGKSEGKSGDKSDGKSGDAGSGSDSKTDTKADTKSASKSGESKSGSGSTAATGGSGASPAPSTPSTSTAKAA